MSNGQDPNLYNISVHSTLKLTGHTKGVTSLKFSGGNLAGKLLASASADKTVRIWDADTGELKRILKGHSNGINDVAWSRDNTLLATASDDQTIRLWDCNTGACLRVLSGHTNFVFCCSFNPRGNLLASGSFDETVKFWSTRDGRCIRDIPAHSDPITSCEFSLDGSVLLTSSFDGIVRLWDTENGSCLKTLMSDETPPVCYTTFTPNEKFVIVATLDNCLRLWDLSSGQIVKVYKGHSNHTCSIFASFLNYKDCNILVSGSEDANVYLFDVNSQQVKFKVNNSKAEDRDDPQDMVLAIRSHPFKPVFVTGETSKDFAIKFWEVGF